MFLFTKDLLDYVEKNEVKFIDWRFTDLVGRWHHLTHSTHSLDPGIFTSGISFDSSSVPGWQPIELSDMLLVPDISTAFLDPFTSQATLTIICNVVCPGDRTDYERDPRYTARKAQHYLASMSFADKCYMGPEIEFFVFDHVRFAADPHSSYFKLSSMECDSSSSKKFGANHGYGVPVRSGYMCPTPMDSLHDMRSEMLSMLDDVGVRPLLHHHEVASSQCEIGFYRAELVACADSVQKCKYVLRSVAGSYGKSITFMPKPVIDENGSGMHCHQSLWKGDSNVFAGDGGSLLSEVCQYYIGGILAHGRALNAFANATTNSYKRLVPNFEAPTRLAFSHCNRSAAVRVPYTHSDSASARRIETRFPDPLSNPYLCFAAQLMAGLDGIKKKIKPTEVKGKSLYTLDDAEAGKLQSVCFSLDEALNALDKDRDFLLEGGVFTNDMIDTYIMLKEREVDEVRIHPHPVEFRNYYSM
ncbi:type I glutamate--ammonia ligase [Candidatus Anaplasma sp. TIGMIC]|uniref:type I glutamate--ammonia ligase n=1 Tax=Candidatus Anaplasma sp. TIGMIC TaxID=3020713 RepID=UPI00232F239C|nr:type I glutamate--ammonia ligase [Candidatus Anaplasma sp. TIGMIC]MDB1135503.1 type I glutamate--ammonia ligase [Candidatus Anaplasma sp. TIGMIC]